MTHIHYKFSSKLSYDTVVFDGPHITLGDLKKQIMGREKLRAADSDLRITNAQNKEEYTDDECLIPKGSSVIVRRIPIIGAKPSTSRTRNTERPDAGPHHAFGSIKAMCDQNSSSTLPLFSKMANLADVDVSEEDKIKVMMNQSAFDSMSYNKKLPLPSNYTCYRCGNAGHHIRHCPTSGDKNFEAPPRIKKSTGIPRSFMVEVDDPNAKGAMLTNCGRYAIPSIDIKAYALGKKERPPFLPQEQPKSEDEEDPVPEELLCLICHDLLSDAVVIPCCGNSYCDDCIRTALLDSDEHVCPTCKQPDVSPDTLIANKFLRQAVDNFQKERGGAKSLRRGCGASQSQNATPTPSPVPTLPPPALPSQPQKPHLSTHQRDPLRRSSPAADTPPSAQVCVAPPTSAGPAQSANTASTSIQPVLSLLEITDKEEEKTHDDSAAAVSPSERTDAPSQIPLVNLTPAAEKPNTVTLQQPSSAPSPRLPAPPACWDSSTDGWSGSITQQLPPSVPPYSATPPPLFPSPHFHAFLGAQPPLGSYPPGYPPTGPVWPLPNLQGAPISSLCPSTAIPALIPKEWYRHQRKKKERSPHRGSSHRRSSTGSKSSKYSKSSPARSYSHSSSRSRSRSRSRSQGRSRPSSPYSRRRDLHSRSHSSRSYSYGYKRSPTPSSSSSPRLGYHSRRKSPTDHRKASHHSRHHSKKSSSSSSSSRRRGEHHQREAGGPGGGFPTYLYAQHANQSSSLELDRERYLQWSREYKEWCDKYFSSYVGHFHQAPLPLLNLPPPPPPQWGERDGHHSHANLDSRNSLQSRRSDPTDGRSPPSQSSSDSRSPPSQSSRDSRSTPSQSSSDSHSSPSPSSNDSRTPPSQTSSDGRSTPSEDLQEGTKGSKKNLEKLSSLKHDQKSTKKHKEGRAEESSSPDAADSLDDRRKDKRTHNTGPCKDTTPAKDEASDDSAKPLVKPDERLAKDYERKSREQRDLEMEKGRRRGKYSDSRQDAGRRNKEKPRKEADRVDSDRYPGGSTASDSRSEKSRKRKGEHSEKSYSQAESSKCLKTQTAEEPRIHKSESPNLCDRKTPKTEKKKESKAWPLKEGDIWEGGISVKPQKKISININLEGKGITGKTSEKACDGEMAAGANERKESERNTEGVSEENTQLDGETQQKWEKATFRDNNGETFEKEEVEKKEEFDLYAALRVDEEKDDGVGMEANKGEEVTPVERSEGQEAPPLGETVTVTQEERAEEENTHPQEDLMEGVKRRKDEEEEDTVRSRSQGSRNQIHHDGPNTAMDDGQSLDSQDKMAVLKSLDESTQDRAADQDQLILIQVPLSKWKKESEEEELGRGATKVQTVLPSASVSVTAESAASRETKDRSVEMAAPFSVAPSSGKDRKDTALCTDRDEEKRIEKDRRRDRDRGREKQKDKRSQERLREEEKGRDRERERRNPPYSYSSSSSHGSERRERQRGSPPGPVRKSSSSGRSRESSTTSRATKLPDQSTHKPVRDKDRHHPPGRRRDRPAGSHKERDRPPSGGESKVIQQAKGERDGSRWEDEVDQLEERESLSSHSNSSSSSQENDRKEKKHKKEKRQSGELLEDSELKKRKKKNSDEQKKKSGGEVGDRWKEEEDHTKLCSLVS